MQLPPDSARSRLRWSAAAGAILCIWQLGILAASAVPFPTPCTFPQMLAAVARDGVHGFWPGEFGGDMWFVQLSPSMAALGWLTCLVPWRARAARVSALVLTLLVPAWYLLLRPEWVLLAPIDAARALFGQLSGEGYEEGGLLGLGVLLWWALLAPLIMATADRPRHTPAGLCRSCGYDLTGTESAVCPECGARRPGPISFV